MYDDKKNGRKNKYKPKTIKHNCVSALLLFLCDLETQIVY